MRNKYNFTFALVLLLAVSQGDSFAQMSSSGTDSTTLKPLPADAKIEPATAKDADVELKPILKPAKPTPEKQAEPVEPGFLMWRTDTLDRVRVDGRAAKKLAKYHWLDKVVQANPEVCEAITNHRRASMILAEHVRIDHIADGDPYLCRRITKWKGAARRLAANPNARKVIDRDPEGIYRAIRRDKKIIRILSKNPIFDQLIVDNPELGRVIAHYM